jgi:imidazolonepropionase-like amidohydrolase
MPLRMPLRMLPLCLLAVACRTPRHATAPSDLLAIQNVTLLSMREGDAPTQAAQTVLLRDGMIEKVGDTAAVTVPPGTRRIDGTGKFLMPGLADMHVHLEYFDHPSVLQLFVANGVTLVRNMDGRAHVLDWRSQVARGELPGPTIVTAGPLLDGDPPLLPDNFVVLDSAAARAAVAAQHAAGYDFIKVYSNLSRAAYRAVLQEARTHGMPVAGHLPRGVSATEAIAAGQQAIEHLGDYDDMLESSDSPMRGRYQWYKRLLGMPIDSARADSLGRALAAAAVWTVPTLVQPEYEIATNADAERWLARPAVRHIPEAGRRLWFERVTASAARLDDEDWARITLGHRNRLATVAALHRAGAPLLVGTDTPNPFLVPGVSLHEELALFVEAGLAPIDVLRIATRHAARFLGLSSRVGTIEAGKRADLLLLDADPLADITNTTRIAGVFVEGKWYSATDLSRMVDTLVLSVTP